MEALPQTGAPSLAALRDRVRDRRHIDTTLAALGDDEFAAGLTALDRAVAEETAAGRTTPVVDRLDLLVLR